MSEAMPGERFEGVIAKIGRSLESHRLHNEVA
jgi:hypothetical protein